MNSTEKLNMKRVVPFGLLFVIALCVALYGAVSLVSSALLVLNGDQGPGTVSVGPGTKVNIVFYDRGGNSHVMNFQHMFSGGLSDREQVAVIFDPSNPSRATVNTVLYLWIPGVMLFALGGSLAALFFYLMDLPLTRTADTHLRDTQSADTSAGSSARSDGRPNAAGTALHASHQASVGSNIFGLLTPLIEDSAVSDIIIESADAIFVKKGSLITKASITFPSQVHYEQLVERMLMQADTSYTVSKPIVDGMVTPLVRIHAVHKVLCETGPYVTLRVSRVSAVTFAEFSRGTMAPREVMHYLRAALLTGHTVLLAGEVGTGKTTLLRALASTIPKHESILVIEDTSEIAIEHPTVRYVRTRESNTEGIGKVSPGECIRAGMRMAMNRIIFGEIRDPEAAESFIDVCVSGHPGMSTVHAKSAADTIARLELLLSRQQPGVDRSALREQIGAAVQVVAYTQICKQTGQRRITEVVEVAKHEGQDAPIRIQEIFRYGVSGSMPYWQVKSHKSFFQHALKEFEGGYSLESLPDVVGLQTA
jgi:pilus assembly protein CpaF